jgi:hypothetical protein
MKMLGWLAMGLILERGMVLITDLVIMGMVIMRIAIMEIVIMPMIMGVLTTIIIYSMEVVKTSLLIIMAIIMLDRPILRPGIQRALKCDLPGLTDGRLILFDGIKALMDGITG